MVWDPSFEHFLNIVLASFSVSVLSYSQKYYAALKTENIFMLSLLLIVEVFADGGFFLQFSVFH